MLLQRPITKTLRPAARWLARKLVYANSYSESKNDVNRVFGRRHPDVVANSPKLIAAPWGGRGLGFGAAGSGSVFDVTNTLVLSKSSAVRSIFFRIALPSTTASGTVFSDAQHERLYFDALGETLSWRRKFSTTNGEWSFSGVFSSGSLTKWFSVALTHDGTTSQPVVYVNGVKVAVTTVTAPVGTYSTDTSSKFSLGAAESFFSVYTPNMVFGDFFVFDSILSQSEVLDLHRDRSALWANAPLNIWLDGPQTGWHTYTPPRKARKPAARWVVRKLMADATWDGAQFVSLEGRRYPYNGVKQKTVKGGVMGGFGTSYGTGSTDLAVRYGDWSSTLAVTVILRLYIFGTTGSNQQIYGEEMDGFPSLSLYYDTSAGHTLVFSRDDLATGVWTTDIASAVNRPVWIAVAQDGSSNTPRFYIDGVEVSAMTLSSPVGWIGSDPLVHGFGSVLDDPTFMGGISHYMRFGSALTAREIRELIANPAALLADAPRTAWSGGLSDAVFPSFLRTQQPQVPVGTDRRALAIFTPSRAGRFTTRAGTMTPVIYQFGRALESSSTGNRIEQLNPNGQLLPSSRLALVFVGRIDPATGGIGVTACLNGVTNYASMLYVFGGADYAGFYPYVGAQVGCTSVPVKGYDIVIVGSYDGTTARVGVRNLNTNQRQINASALSGSTDFDRFRVGPTFSSQLFSTYFSGAFLDPLSAGEINAILDNPWRLLEPTKRRLHGIQLTTSGIPMLSLAQVINILQTQATPRVTITF